MLAAGGFVLVALYWIVTAPAFIASAEWVERHRIIAIAVGLLLTAPFALAVWRMDHLAKIGADWDPERRWAWVTRLPWWFRVFSGGLGAVVFTFFAQVIILDAMPYFQTPNDGHTLMVETVLASRSDVRGNKVWAFEDGRALSHRSLLVPSRALLYCPSRGSRAVVYGRGGPHGVHVDRVRIKDAVHDDLISVDLARGRYHLPERCL